MKRGIIIAVAAISMAGAASASIFTKLPEGATAARGSASAPVGVSDAAPPAVKPSLFQARLAEPSAEPTAKPAPAAVERRSPVVARQKPVPLQVASRPPVPLPSADTSEAYAKGEAGASAKAVTSPSRSDDQAGEKAARAAIEADGYKGVEVLRKGDNGIWYAKAMRGKTEVQLVVDLKGSVTTAE
jgi:hypothetical protein